MELDPTAVTPFGGSSVGDCRMLKGSRNNRGVGCSWRWGHVVFFCGEGDNPV